MPRPKTGPPQQLTKAELDIMQIIWNLRQATVTQILQQIQPPQPAYNTVSTIVRILVNKGFLDYVPSGKTHIYKTIVSKEYYATKTAKTLLETLFDNSMSKMVATIHQNQKLSPHEINQIIKILQK